MLLIRLVVIAIAVLPLAVQADSDAELTKALRSSIDQLEKRLAALEQQQTQQVEQDKNTAAVEVVQAQADTIWNTHFYGKLRVSADNRAGDFDDNRTSLSSNASRIGVYGTIPTSVSQMNAIYRAELQYEATKADQSQLSWRDAYAGLQSPDWGTLRLGRLTTAYKITLEKVDPWIDNALESHAFGRQGSSEFHANFFNSAIDYTTPFFGNGITGSVWYALALSDSSQALHNTGTLQNYMGGGAGGIGVQYEAGPVFLGADYINIDADIINLAGLHNGDGFQVAGRYTFFNKLTLGVFYEDVKDLGLGENYNVNAIYEFNRFRFIASYGGNDNSTVYGNSKYTNWNVGVKYALSKDSELIAGFDQRQDDTLGLSFDTFTIGLNTNFDN